ncbi:hypothetical protein [Cryptosporangium phraense]|uniref:Uncharacterized protein n=1 Tax=Cryptosporangium phraense TaxID=2593070 RepID=A0A545APH4_9ACTN|nr:hypothetical protein [Cryptosporangium phraense]TQS43206.1 hypothetical protein FL583_20385 [Cryptosporangium phraense]
MDIRPADYLEYATVYFWDESGSFSAEAERHGGHRPYPGRQNRNSETRHHRCGGAVRPGTGTAQASRRHP